MPKKLIISYLLVVAWMLVIFLFSNEGATVSDTRSDAIVGVVSAIVSWDNTILTVLVRKAAHIVAYFVLGALLFNAIRQHRLGALQAATISIAVAALYAILDETHQLFVAGRSGEVRDVLLDTVAAIGGTAACYGILRIVNKRSKTKRQA